MLGSDQSSPSATPDLTLATAALADSERRYQHLVDNATDLIYQLDPYGRITDFNPSAVAILQYPREEILGRYYLDFVVPEYRQECYEFYARQILGAIQTTYYEVPVVARDGSHVWLGQYAQLARANGQIVGVHAIARDITEKRRIAAALAEARDQAIEASRLKSEFLAMMTHEIRTPLAGIIGMTDLLLETPLVGEQRDFTSVIRRQADSLLETLNDILDFSRLEAGRLQLDDGEIDVAALLAEALAVLAPQLKAKRLELRQTIAPAVPARVRGDAQRLRQILINLLGNSVKFTESGSIGIEVDVAHELASEETLRFQVTDTGIGISAQVLRRLFQPFSPGDSSAMRRYSGTGLGLAISKRLVELMGGEIGVETVGGQGSTFWFRIPCRRLADSEPTPTTTVDSAAGTLATGVSSGTHGTLEIPAPGKGPAPLVLLAEDYPDNQKLATIMLERLGYAAQIVETGTQAVEAVAHNAPAYALILMDFQLPELDGFAATRAIRQAEAGTGQRIPIIAMTANATSRDREACLAAGMDDYLSKPVTRAELRRVLDRWARRPVAAP